MVPSTRRLLVLWALGGAGCELLYPFDRFSVAQRDAGSSEAVVDAAGDALAMDSSEDGLAADMPGSDRSTADTLAPDGTQEDHLPDLARPGDTASDAEDGDLGSAVDTAAPRDTVAPLDTRPETALSRTLAPSGPRIERWCAGPARPCVRASRPA
jgi:hypothetical protein